MKKRANGKQDNSLKTLRKELLHKKEELLVSLGIHSKRVAEAERISEEDQSTVLKDEFLRLSVNRLLFSELRQVESALALMESGEHGTCAECGATISPKRLQAVPWARYCVDCQDKAGDGKAQEPASIAMEY